MESSLVLSQSPRFVNFFQTFGKGSSGVLGEEVYLIDLPRFTMHTSTSSPPPKPSGETFLQSVTVNESFQEISRLMSEGRAVAMACEAIEGRESPLRVQQFIKGLFRNQPSDTVEDLVTWYAMGKIIQEELPAPARIDEDPEDSERALFLAVAWAWMTWVSGGSKTSALAELDRLNFQEESSPNVLHHLALSNWAFAVRALLMGKTKEAKRRYRRALDVGSQFGTESNSVIVWTYAASFHPGT